MTKTEFVRTLAKKHHRSEAHYTQALNDMLAELTQQLAHGKSVPLTGFGTFQLSQRNAATIRNVRGGAALAVPAHRRVHFRVGDVLKRAVRK